MLKKIIIVLTLALWPINLYLANIQSDFISYSLPVLLLVVSFFLYKRYPKYYLLPIILIGISEKKLVLLPIIFCALEIITKFTKTSLIFLIISIAIFSFQFSSWRGQTVFVKDYEAEQLILRNIHLYPNIFTARIFQNKSKIYLNKISNNFFTLTDPNNYFFASHPSQTTISNQNLYKYPFVGIIFFLYGIFYIKHDSSKKFIWIFFVSSIISLCVLNNFDRNDFILWFPISLIIINGIDQMSKRHKNIYSILSIFFIIFAIPQYLTNMIERNK